MQNNNCKALIMGKLAILPSEKTSTTLKLES